MEAGSGTSWVLQQVPALVTSKRTVSLRAGYLPEAQDQPFRGNILYMEGFADSMLNHQSLFQALTRQGFRLISFDYPGQGGSEGSMNMSSIPRIQELGRQIWDRFARRDGPQMRTWMGWSTGGLAAYLEASKEGVERVILIAPGIHIHPIVGRRGKVTPDTLTSHQNKRLPDPHLEPPFPTAPARFPRFAASILKNSLVSQQREISSGISGLVLLSGPEDRYVRGAATRKTLQRRAPHFTVLTFEAALHEIHNEVEPIAAEAQEMILEFLHRSGR
jgi:alpha-beta hydrolase superfamily lysophospholipase